MGQGIDYILTAVMTSAASQALKYTVLSGQSPYFHIFAILMFANSNVMLY